MDTCQICGGDAKLELETGEFHNLSGDICDVCDKWVCQSCLDHKKSGIDYDNVCVECSQKIDEGYQMCPECGEIAEWDKFDKELLVCEDCASENRDLSRGRWVEKVEAWYSAVPFMTNIIALNPNVYSIGYYKTEDGDAHVMLDVGDKKENVAEDIFIDEVNFCYDGKTFDITFWVYGYYITLNFYSNEKDYNFLDYSEFLDKGLTIEEAKEKLDDFIKSSFSIDKVYNFKYRTHYENF